MPGYLVKEDALCNSYAELEPASLGRLGKLVLYLCERLRLAHVVRTPGERVVKLSNLTIINYALYVLGPMHEARLTTVLLLFQVVQRTRTVVRYQLAGLYEVVKEGHARARATTADAKAWAAVRRAEAASFAWLRARLIPVSCEVARANRFSGPAVSIRSIESHCGCAPWSNGTHRTTRTEWGTERTPAIIFSLGRERYNRNGDVIEPQPREALLCLSCSRFLLRVHEKVIFLLSDET